MKKLAQCPCLKRVMSRMIVLVEDSLLKLSWVVFCQVFSDFLKTLFNKQVLHSLALQKVSRQNALNTVDMTCSL